MYRSRPGCGAFGLGCGIASKTNAYHGIMNGVPLTISNDLSLSFSVAKSLRLAFASSGLLQTVNSTPPFQRPAFQAFIAYAPLEEGGESGISLHLTLSCDLSDLLGSKTGRGSGSSIEVYVGSTHVLLATSGVTEMPEHVRGAMISPRLGSSRPEHALLSYGTIPSKHLPQ